MQPGSFKRYKKSDEVPRRKRRATSRMEALPQWELMRQAIDAKLKPNEALEITVTPDDRKKYHIQSRRTMSRFVDKYVRSVNLPYRVVSFNRDGIDHVQVRYTPVIAKTA